MPGIRDWPAKVMAIENDMVNVEFFGDHTQDEVLADSCFLFSTNDLIKVEEDKEYSAAIDVS